MTAHRRSDRERACSSCGVATYTAPSQFRPGAARWSEESVVSSRTTFRDPSAAAMPRAPAAIAASWAPVRAGQPAGERRQGAFGVVAASCG